MQHYDWFHSGKRLTTSKYTLCAMSFADSGSQSSTSKVPVWKGDTQGVQNSNDKGLYSSTWG